MRDVKKSKIKFIVEPRLLDHIGLAMYSSMPKAISELVANSYDADAENVRISLPEGNINEKSKIIIQDDGQGMDEKDIRDIYMHLGINVRKRRKRTPKFKRLPIGSKGIGKIAGLGIANKMVIQTTKDNFRYSFEIDRQRLEATVDLRDIEFDLTKEEVKCGKGTKITLENLLSHVKSSITKQDLLRFFHREFGLTRDFNIYINGERMSPRDIPGELLGIKDQINPYGEITGKIKIAERPRDIRTPGIITYVRGRSIIGPTLFDINTRGHQYRVADRIVGELEVNFLDPEEPSEILDEFIIATSRDNFAQDNPRYIAYKKWAEEKLIEIARRLEKDQEKARKEKLIKHRSVQALLRGLPKEIRKRVLDLIEDIIPKLDNLSDDDADTILQIIVKAAESGAIVEILRKIKEAAPTDVKRLADLLNEWGIYEISAISELIKHRLGILEEFEILVNSLDTLEFPDIHKLIENNLWLLDDNYRLYSSNKSLRTILEKEIEKKFKEHERERPDLICKTLLDKVVIIELKRPGDLVIPSHFTQLTLYQNIIKQHSPVYKIIECYLIGSRYDEAVRNPDYEKIGIYLKSYSEVVQGAKERYREILEILNSEEERAR